MRFFNGSFLSITHELWHSPDIKPYQLSHFETRKHVFLFVERMPNGEEWRMQIRKHGTMPCRPVLSCTLSPKCPQFASHRVHLHDSSTQQNTYMIYFEANFFKRIDYSNIKLAKPHNTSKHIILIQNVRKSLRFVHIIYSYYNN